MLWSLSSFLDAFLKQKAKEANPISLPEHVSCNFLVILIEYSLDFCFDPTQIWFLNPVFCSGGWWTIGVPPENPETSKLSVV